MGGVIEAPIAGELLDFVAAVHAGVGRHHVHAQAEGGFEEALVPFERNVAGLLGMAVFVEGAREQVFVVVEEAAVLEGGRVLREVGLLED